MNFCWAEENRNSSPPSSAVYLFVSFAVHGSCRERTELEQASQHLTMNYFHLLHWDKLAYTKRYMKCFPPKWYLLFKKCNSYSDKMIVVVKIQVLLQLWAIWKCTLSKERVLQMLLNDFTFFSPKAQILGHACCHWILTHLSACIPAYHMFRSGRVFSLVSNNCAPSSTPSKTHTHTRVYCSHP